MSDELNYAERTIRAGNNKHEADMRAAGISFDNVVTNDTGVLPRSVMAFVQGISEWNGSVAA